MENAMNTETESAVDALRLSVCFARQAVEGNRWITHRWALVGLSVGATPPPAG